MLDQCRKLHDIIKTLVQTHCLYFFVYKADLHNAWLCLWCIFFSRLVVNPPMKHLSFLLHSFHHRLVVYIFHNELETADKQFHIFANSNNIQFATRCAFNVTTTFHVYNGGIHDLISIFNHHYTILYSHTKLSVLDHVHST